MNCFTKLWKIQLGDWGRGLLIAILTAPLTIIYQSLMATPVTLIFDWTSIIGAGLAGGIGYILKNLATGQNGNLLSNK